MRKFILSATALTAMSLGFAASASASEINLDAKLMDTSLHTFQRLAAVPNRTGCALISSTYSPDGRDEQIKFVRGDSGCAKTAVNVRRAGTAALARTELPNKISADSPHDVLDSYLTFISNNIEAPTIMIAQARLIDEGVGIVDYQLIQDSNGTKVNITASRDPASAVVVASMRDNLRREMSPPVTPELAPPYIAGTGYLQSVSAGDQGKKDCVAAATFQFLGEPGGLRNTAFEADAAASCRAVHKLVDEAMTKPDLGLSGGQTLSTSDPRVLELLSRLAHDQLGEAKDGKGVSLGEAQVETSESAIRIRVVTRGAQRWLAAVSFGNDNESRLQADDMADLSAVVDTAFGG